ncbi:Fanconi anemia group I protein homolog-like Protein [Tribolium castaneum]|uniref:Fanconi anemia group I protein homolog-like Protein n=1 Tax=Tribolium castaneum TaxID=7070 RepID=D6WCF1_TRICA|nr:PREDICTED: Fanconi anemia group I protein homolog [Tribolium castaneum]EEZ98882.2 Fanconi anemia group I protein homolog-like Protein [Tribolium castaneum]|eukprot:XP_008200886.1 PREDICTED: Fanconi anemia group I protein homolog [Tribolium castaneum]
MTSIEEKIRKLGQNRDIEGLQDYVSNLSLEELVNVIRTRLTNSNFTYTWNYILEGLAESPNSHNKRYGVVLSVIEELDRSEVSSFHSNAITSRICTELAKFQTEHLLKLCDFCVESLQSGRVSQMSWKEILPQLLNVLSKKEHVDVEGEEISGIEYKHQVINNICTLQWSPNIVVNLTQMFIDLSLSKEEHLQVVNKLAKQLEKMTPQEVPPFVYQLLKFCKNSSASVIFIKLQHYFALRYHDKFLDQTASSSESSEMDLIEDASSQDILEAEATVLYHIHSLAFVGHNCIKDHLNFLKNMLRTPEFILHPFQLSVLLTLSTIPRYEERVFEIIRSCVSRTFHEEQKKISSASFRNLVPGKTRLEIIFGHVVTASAQDRDLVLQGLINFAFVLLGVGSALGRDPIAEKQWQLGSIILIKIIKRKRHTASIIVETLCNKIVTEQSVTQYIECLYLMTRKLALLMLENKNTIISLMGGLIEIPLTSALLVLDAIIPLTKVSPTIRDHFILLLHKALHSRVTETRQVAVTGYLKLLANLKISDLAILSQGSYSSGYSLYTQISITQTSQCTPSAFSNEALSLEVLNNLEACFMQPAEVRIQLYTGLYDAVCLNPDLGIAVLETIWPHFCDFYNTDEETAVPLKFDKITLTRDINVSLQEPLGKLIYTIGLIVTKVAKDNNETPTVARILKVLESICQRMIKCELVHFELDDGTDLGDVMPESQHKLFVLKEAMSVYEALIGYKFHSWELDSENNGKQIKGLFEGYLRLSNCLKTVNKPKKSDKNKTENDTTLKKEQKSSNRLKLPETVLDFQVLSKIMSFLHETMVSWTTCVQANVVKSKREFHQHAMQATLNLVTSLKHKKNIETQTAKVLYDHLCDIAMVIYERIIKRMDEFASFDCTTAVLAAECFLLILNIVNNHHGSNLKAFLSRVGGRDTSEDLVSHLSEFIQTYQKLFETDEDEISEDPEVKKMSLIVINTLSFFAHQIPPNSNTLALQMMEWTKNYALNNDLKGRQVVNGFITLLFECHVNFKVSLTFFEQVSDHIGDVTGVITEEEHTSEEMKVLNEQTVNTVFTCLCNNIKSVLEDIDWVIARLKAEFSLMTYPNDEGLERRRENLQSRERGVCCQLCFIVTILTNLSNCTIPPGGLSEALLKNLFLLYCTLSSLTKHFVLRSSKINPVFQNAKFERLVKLAGKQLAPAVYKLITYIEETQKEEPESPSKKSKKKVESTTLKSKVLKETRLIPKVVYEIEQFGKLVAQLSNKTKIDLAKFMGQGTVRGFRFLNWEQVVEKANDGAPQTQDSEENNEESDEETSPPPSKQRKT